MGAAIWDIFCHKIPNIWIVGGLFAGATTVLFSGRSDTVLYFMRIFLMFAIISPLFYFRMMGAGDIKLISILSGLAGFKDGFMILILSLCLAAPICLLKMLYKNNFKQRLTYFYVYFRQLYLTKKREAYHSPIKDGYEDTIPFAVFLFAGAVITKIFLLR